MVEHRKHRKWKKKEKQDKPLTTEMEKIYSPHYLPNKYSTSGRNIHLKTGSPLP